LQSLQAVALTIVVKKSGQPFPERTLPELLFPVLLFLIQVQGFASSAFPAAPLAQDLIHLELLSLAHLFQLKDFQLLKVLSSTPGPALLVPDA
jgi:hypothetical protein